MRRKRGQPDFNMSEPEFLISVMDRLPDWCTVVCLVGGGQEINTGEAGISEWIIALETRFPEWEIYVSPRISLPEYVSQVKVEEFLSSPRVRSEEQLHLAVSMRSFRAENPFKTNRSNNRQRVGSCANCPRNHKGSISDFFNSGC